MNKIILALDTTDLEKALTIANTIKDKIFTIKLGLEFFNAHGKKGVKQFNEIGITNLVLDLKLKDIPETVYKAIKVLNDIKFGFLTIHGQGGKTMIDRAKKAASEINSQPKKFRVVVNCIIITIKIASYSLKKLMVLTEYFKCGIFRIAWEKKNYKLRKKKI